MGQKVRKIVGVVMGAGFISGTSELDVHQEARCQKAAQLYLEGIINAIIVTGFTKNQQGDIIVYKARDYLVGLGIPKKDILISDKDKDMNTEGEIRGALAVIYRKRFKFVIIISEDAHMNRAFGNSKDLDNKITYLLAPDDYPASAKYWIRELSLSLVHKIFKNSKLENFLKKVWKHIP